AAGGSGSVVEADSARCGVSKGGGYRQSVTPRRKCKVCREASRGVYSIDSLSKSSTAPGRGLPLALPAGCGNAPAKRTARHGLTTGRTFRTFRPEESAN